MKKSIFIIPSTVFVLIALIFGIFTTVSALPGETRLLQESSLPQIIYLGQGPQTFTVEPPREFLVKTYQDGQFLFVTVDGPTYEAANNERVWTTDFVPAEPIRLFDEGRSYGNVPAGCVVNYVQIEDNDDTRRNTFFINGEVLQVVEQGMVTYGTFTVPEAGELTFFAEDSIGMVIEFCQTVETEVPGETPTVTSTTEIVSTATSTTEIVPPTETSTPEPGSPTPTNTQPVTVSTATATLQPTAEIIVITLTPNPQPTSTVQIIYITATPIATPLILPVTGGGPGPGDIAAISAAIIGLFGLIAAGWWFLLRAYQRDR